MLVIKQYFRGKNVRKLNNKNLKDSVNNNRYD